MKVEFGTLDVWVIIPTISLDMAITALSERERDITFDPLERSTL